MLIHPHYISDNTGKIISAILPIKEFQTLLEELEELEDIKLYDKAKKDNENERILLSDYIKNRNLKHA